MANGLLGKAVITSIGTWTTVYTVPASGVQFATASIMLCNKATTDATVSVAVTTLATPGDADFIEYNAIIPASGGVLERTCIPVSAGETITVISNKTLVAVQVRGLEEPV